MTALAGAWRVWGFPALLLLAVLIAGLREGYNRLAAPQASVLIAECRLTLAPARDGLLAAVLPERGPLSLTVASAYAPPDAARPAAARLADMGAHPARPPVRGYILVEQDGRPAGTETGDASLVARDFAVDADYLRRRYADRPGSAVLRGVIAARTEGGEIIPRLTAEQTVLAVPRALKRDLAALPARPADEPCRSRYLAEITVGALGSPRLSGIRMLRDAAD